GAASLCRGASRPMQDHPQSDESRLVQLPSTPRRSCDLGRWRSSGALVSRRSSCRSLFCPVPNNNPVGMTLDILAVIAVLVGRGRSNSDERFGVFLLNKAA